MNGALVLNASYEPLCVVPVRRALVLVLNAKAEVVSIKARPFRSERNVFETPSVIRLVHYVRVPFRNRVPLNRRAVFARDHHRCQYCGSAAENIDHVIPRSRGGQHVWENVVASCTPCNARKGDKMLDQTNFVLRRHPVAPHALTWVMAAVGNVSPDWEPFLAAA